jgi:O-antigen chain-terminating methyltransferase
MEFLPEYYGFYRVKILRLQEPFNLSDERRFGIHDVLGGVSPDYAVVAQKAADPTILQKVSQALDKDYGVTLGMMASRYEGQRDESLQELDHRANENLAIVDQSLRTQIQAVEGNFAQNLQHQLNTLDYKLNVLIQQVDANQDRRLVLLERQLREAELQLQKIEARRPLSLLKRAIKKVLRVVSNRTKVFLSNRPALHGRLVAMARRIGIYKLLNRVLNRAASNASAAPVSPAPTATDLTTGSVSDLGKILKDQTSDVRDIYRELDVAIKKTEDR